MLINRVAGLVLPYSTKFLIDNVIAKHHIERLRRLVLVVLGGDADSGHHLVLADAVAVEGGAAADC